MIMVVNGGTRRSGVVRWTLLRISIAIACNRGSLAPVNDAAPKRKSGTQAGRLSAGTDMMVGIAPLTARRCGTLDKRTAVCPRRVCEFRVHGLRSPQS